MAAIQGLAGSYRARFLLLGAAVALPLLFFGLLGAVRDQNARETALEEDQVSLARAAAVAADGFLQGDAAAVRALAALPSTQNAAGGDLGTAEAAMRSVLQAFPNVETLGLIGSDGWNVLSLTPQTLVPARTVFVGDRPYVRDALSSRQPVLSSAVLSRVRPGVPVVAIAVPIYDAAGTQTGGVLIGTLALGRLREVIQGALDDPRLAIVIVDGDGQALVMPGVDPADARALLSLSGQPAIESALAGQAGTWRGVPPTSTEEMLVGFAPVPETNWAVLIQQPAAAALAPAREEALRSVGLLTLALALSLGAALVLTSRLTRSHRDLEAARQAAERGRERATFLAEAGGQLAISLDAGAALEAAARSAVPWLADLSVVELTPTGPTLTRALALAHADPTLEANARQLFECYPSNLGEADRVLRSGQALLEADLSDADLAARVSDVTHLELLRALGAHAWMVLPLRGRGGTVGTMRLVASDPRRQYGADELALAQELADRAALAVENARLYAQVQRAVRTRDEFLATASHDLKNPLASVKAQAQLLMRRAGRTTELVSSDVFEVARRMDTTVTRAAVQLDELLDVARLQLGGPLQLDRDAVDLVRLAREAVAEYTAAGEPHRVRLDARVAALVGQWDARRLQRVIDNLLSNALKYSREDAEVVVRVDGAQDAAVLSVEDQGIGIPSADLPNIFERFQRGSNVVGRVDGTGVGLASTRYIVESHGGTVSIESQEGRGTRVTVRLPLGPTADG
jgi:signal transduction histidine kinase